MRQMESGRTRRGAAPAGGRALPSAPVDARSRAAVVTSLQRSCGNGAVQRLIAQRSPAFTRGVTLDPHAREALLNNLFLNGFEGLSDEEKLEVAEQILSTMSRAGKGPRTMYGLWESFGDRVVPVAVANAELWKRCAAYVPRPWELHNLPPVRRSPRRSDGTPNGWPTAT